MALSLQDERRRQGESKQSNFVEIFKGTNLRRFFISAAIPLFAQLSGNSVRLITTCETHGMKLMCLDGQRVHFM